MSKKILVTPRSITRDGHPALQLLRDAGFEVIFCTPGKSPGEEELIKLLPGCVGFLAGVEKVSARVLESARDLKAISRNGTGVDNVDLVSASRLGIQVCRADGANARGVAELVITLMMALVRDLPFVDRSIKAGGWERRGGMEIEGKTLGLIGCGKIGKLVTKLATGLGMNVIGYDPFPDASFAPAGFRYGSMDAVLAAADILSLHCPPPKDGRPLLDVVNLGKLKKGVYVINTARAGLIDDTVMLEALDDGRIAGLATDVFVEEPPKDLRLAQHNRVIASPHIGGFTRESVDRAVEVAVGNLIQALKK